MIRNLTRPLTRGLTRALSPQLLDPVITGTPYPGETLTSTIAGQWFADDVAITGETGSSVTVGLFDIGKKYRCGNSNELTIWHPNQIAAVRSFWMAERMVYTSIDPEVLATNGQSVRRWRDIVSGSRAGQSSGTQQPIWQSENSNAGDNPAVVFDGSNDHFLLAEDSLGDIRNKNQAYIGAGCRDTNRTAGAASHFPIGFSAGGGTLSRLAVATRFGGNLQFAAIGRRLDVDGLTTASVTSNDDYNSITAHGDFSAGFIRIRLNGNASASAALASSGPTSDTDSQSAAIGDSRDGAALHFPGPITSAWIANAALTATQLSQLERYCGLLGGRTNIPLV
jgi:hypothetical protein